MGRIVGWIPRLAQSSLTEAITLARCSKPSMTSVIKIGSRFHDGIQWGENTSLCH